MDTMKAVPTPRFDVGEVLLAAQPLERHMSQAKHYISESCLVGEGTMSHTEPDTLT